MKRPEKIWVARKKRITNKWSFFFIGIALEIIIASIGLKLLISFPTSFFPVLLILGSIIIGTIFTFIFVQSNFYSEQPNVIYYKKSKILRKL